MTKSRQSSLTSPSGAGEDARSAYCRAKKVELAQLKRRSFMGTWSLALFLPLSAAAWYRFPFLPPPASFISVLGAPPPPSLVTLSFVVYTFFAIVLNLARMMSDIRSYGIFNHVVFLGGFYFFFYVNETLDDNFLAVFAAGITILIIESYRIYSYCREHSNHIREALAHVEKTGRLPLDD